jgi:hypothetical protein
MHNQFDLAIAFANVVVQTLNDAKIEKGKSIHIGHAELTDDFVNSDLCTKMIDNITLRLKQKGIDVHITIGKVKDNQHQLNIEIQ